MDGAEKGKTSLQKYAQCHTMAKGGKHGTESVSRVHPTQPSVKYCHPKPKSRKGIRLV